MNKGLEALSAASLAFEAEVSDYAQVWEEAKRAEAEYKREGAIFRVKCKAENPTHTVSHITDLALEDDTLYALWLNAIDCEAKLKGKDKRLESLAKRIDTGRTYVANERESNKVHASGYGYGS